MLSASPPEYDPSVLAEGQAVLKDLLELIRSQDEAHYKAMIQLVFPPAQPAQKAGTEI